MTPHATTAEDHVATLGIHLPDAPTPFGAYVPAVQKIDVKAETRKILGAAILGTGATRRSRWYWTS